MQHSEPQAMSSRSFDIRMLAAYATIYLVWGSTFLAIRYALESFPPLLLIGLRSGIAGGVLFGWVLLRGEAWPSWREWRAAAVGGVCFFVLCHGSLAWAEQHVPSGLAAVLLALIPVWVVVLDWLRPGGVRPSGPTLVGLLLGFGGVIVLLGPSIVSSGLSTDVFAAAVLVLSALAWAVGSLSTRSTALDTSPAAVSAMQLLWGGSILLLAATGTGEWGSLAMNTLTPRAMLSLMYLVVLGSLLTFSTYIWLLRVSSPARVATYAYVNPIVALALGWVWGAETPTGQSFLAMGCIVFGVVVIISWQRKPSEAR